MSCKNQLVTPLLMLNTYILKRYMQINRIWNKYCSELWSKVHHLCEHSQSMIDWMDFFVVTVSSVLFFRYQCVHKIASISCGQNSKKSVHHITAAIKFKIQYTPNNIEIRPQSEIFIKFVYYSKSLKSPKIWSPNYFTTSLITTILYKCFFFLLSYSIFVTL